MKKMIAAILALILALGLCACGAAPAESTAAETAGTDAQPAEETNADSFEADKEKGLALFRDEDYEGAYEVLAQYADSGDAEISGVIGYCYYGGWGVEQDDAKAAEYLSIAADADISEAQYMMGILYEYGYGVEQDDVKAAEYEAKGRGCRVRRRTA